MKAILMSIKPQWVKEILNGNKTIEIRKRFPKDYIGWVYIYCTKQNDLFKSYIRMGYYTTPSTADSMEYNGKGKVVARFWCDKVKKIIKRYIPNDSFIYSASGCLLSQESCLSQEELDNYLKAKIGETKGYAIHITKIEIFDKPKEFNEFKKYYRSKGYPRNQSWYLTKAPQSWCYVEDSL